MPECDGDISLVVGGCAMMDRNERISINTPIGMQFGRVRKWARTDGKARSRPGYRTGYQLPADVIRRWICKLRSLP